MKRWMTIWAMLLLAVVGQGQDIHFSQVDADPVLLNPAYSGFYEGVGRFGMVYRNQWASVSIPYQTLAVSGEMALWRVGTSCDSVLSAVEQGRDEYFVGGFGRRLCAERF